LYSWVKCRRVATRFPPLAISGSLRPGVYKIGDGPDLAVELALKVAELVERIATEEGLAAVDVADVLLLE
jgi:hypothetical protein